MLLRAAALAVSAAFSFSSMAEPMPKLVTEQFMIDAADPGIKLYVRNKRPEEMTQFTSQKTLLFVHGGTLPSEASFDFPLEGFSWMDYVARHGWDVYLVDVRGYGGSIRPPEMAQPAANNPPVASYDEAVKDVGVAVDFILKRRGVPKLNLIGWSHGTVLMGAYAARHAEKVERLVLHAPPWLRTPSSSQTATRQFGAYDETTIAIVRERQQVGAPENRKNDLMPMAWFETWAAAVLASDPLSSKQNPPVLRYPTGMRQGVRNYWEAGKPYYDPERIKAPTLVIVGEWDGVAPPEGAHAIFRKLPSGPDKRLVQLGEGTHLIMLEKNRMQLFREVQFFLDRGSQAN
jgi:pimeloyl-ACP methyl ester carboxylesterase